MGLYLYQTSFKQIQIYYFLGTNRLRSIYLHRDHNHFAFEAIQSLRNNHLNSAQVRPRLRQVCIGRQQGLQVPKVQPGAFSMETYPHDPVVCLLPWGSQRRTRAPGAAAAYSSTLLRERRRLFAALQLRTTLLDFLHLLQEGPEPIGEASRAGQRHPADYCPMSSSTLQEAGRVVLVSVVGDQHWFSIGDRGANQFSRRILDDIC
mmetsp:Transcript_17881/g.58778  ORF Transcript_17881/g.58778 Transcript_17881/m.58778 type:complete len:205 (+) Transcript_17881:59-673(+)